MFDFLDLSTLFFIGAVNSFICALMLFGLRRLHPESRPALLWGSVTTLLVGLAMALFTTRGHLPDAVSVLLANLLATMGSLAIYQGFRLLCLCPPRNLLFWSIAAVLAGIHLALGSGMENHPARIIVACATQASGTLLAVPLLLRRRGIDAPLPLHWSIGVMCVLALVNIGRLVGLVLNGYQVDGGGELTGSTIQALAISLYSLGPMAFALSFVGIVSARIAGDLRRLAITDSLTGLLTRRGFHDRAVRMLGRSDGQTGAMAVMMLDIDHFKAINDRFGHGCGDRVLRRFGRLLEEVLPSHAISGRHGGEEFCVLVECGDAEAARRLAESICERVRIEKIVDGGHRIRFSVSIGVSTDPFDGSRFEDLLVVADRRAYFAKDAGRDRVVADDDVSTLVRAASGQRHLVPI